MKKALAALLIVAALVISVVPASLANEGFSFSALSGSSKTTAGTDTGLGTLTISKQLGTKVSYGGGNGGYHYEASFPTQPNNHSHYDHNLDRYLGNNNNNNGNWFQYNVFTYDEGTDTFTYLDWDADVGNYVLVDTEGYARFDLVQGDKLKLVGEYLVSYDSAKKEFMLTLVTDAEYLVSTDATFSISNDIAKGMKNKNSFPKGADPDEYIWTTSPGQLAFPKNKPVTMNGDSITFKAPWVKFTDNNGDLKEVNLHIWIDGAVGYKNTNGEKADRMFEVEVTKLKDGSVQTVYVPINGSAKLAGLEEGWYLLKEIESGYKGDFTINGKTTAGYGLVYVDAKGASVNIKNVPGETDLGMLVIQKTVDLSDEYIAKYTKKYGELPDLTFSFTVTDADDVLVDSFTLTAGGIYVIPYLADGVYTVVEEDVDMPGWSVSYLGDAEITDGGNAFVDVINAFDVSQITGADLDVIKKVETDDGYDYPYAGSDKCGNALFDQYEFAIFEAILGDDGYELGDELFREISGLYSGIASFELDAGAYFVYEDMSVGQAELYVLSENNDNVYVIDGESYILLLITADDDYVSLDVYNDIRYYEFTVTKLIQSGCGYSLADEEFTFELYDENDELVQTQTTVNGVATFVVPFGDYYVVEAMSESQEQRFVVNACQGDVYVNILGNVDFKNDIRYYSFDVTKKVELTTGGYGLGEGFVFKLFDTDDNLVQWKKTNAYGVASFVVPFGEYYVAEAMTGAQSATFAFGEQNADGYIDVTLDGKKCFYNDIKRGSVTVSLDASSYKEITTTTVNSSGVGFVTGGYTYDPLVAGSNDHSIYYHNLAAALGEKTDWSQFNMFVLDENGYTYEIWDETEYIWVTDENAAAFDFVSNNDVVAKGSYEISYLGGGYFYISIVDGALKNSTISISNTIDKSGKANHSIYAINANQNFQQFSFNGQGDKTEFTIYAPWVDVDEDVFVYITGNLTSIITTTTVTPVSGVVIGEIFDVIVTDENGVVYEGTLETINGIATLTVDGLLPGNYTVTVIPPETGTWTLNDDGVFEILVVGGEDTPVDVHAVLWL